MTEYPPGYPPPGFPPPSGYPAPPSGYPAPPPVGYPPVGYGYVAPPSATTNSMAIGALVSGLLGWVICGIGSVVGVVLGIIALRQIKQTGQGGRGLAMAGIIVGGIGTAVGVGVVLFYLYFVVLLASMTPHHHSSAPELMTVGHQLFSAAA